MSDRLYIIEARAAVQNAKRERILTDFPDRTAAEKLALVFFQLNGIKTSGRGTN